MSILLIKPIKLLALIFILVSSTYAQTLSIVTTDNNPPYSFTLPDKTVTGLYIEFWQLWAKHNNHDINFIVDSIQKSLEKAKQDSTIHSGLFKNDKLAQWADFSLPIHRIDTGILLSRKHNQSKQLSEIQNAKIAVYQNSNVIQLLKEKYPNMVIEVVSDSSAVINQLINNKLDGMVAEIPYIKAELSKHRLNGVLQISNEIIIQNTVHALVSQSNQDLVNIVNTGITNIPINELIELEKKWLPEIEPFHKIKQQISFLTNEENLWLKSHSSFSLGIDTSWYPFDYTDENGQFSGIAADYIRYVSETLGVHFNPEYKYKWTESFKLLKDGKIDVMSGVIATDKRRKKFAFTQSYFKAATVIRNKKDSFTIDNINDLLGKKLGLVKGFAIVELVKNDYPDIQIELVDTIVEGLESVHNGKIDAYLGTLAVINHEIDKQDFDDIQIAAFSPYKFEISMAVRKGLEPLVPILNKAFDTMSEKQKASIANDWLSVHVSTGTNIYTIMKWSLPILSFLLFIILLISRYNKTLQNQIHQRLQAEKELKYLANHDTLTGLSNWHNFEKKFADLNQSIEKQNSAILFIDLDEFKSINDSLGHATGDKVLIKAASLLTFCVKDFGLLARIGGDEFIVYLYKIQDLEHIKIICQSILKTISRPFKVENNIINIGASIGISLCPTHANDLNSLVQIADDAMYKAKQSGKNRFHIHELN